MAKKLSMMINRDHPEVCRAVILEDGRINDYIVENVSQEKIKGNIYLGVINRVEPAIEAAFVDIGGSKYGFLSFKDVLKESYVDTGEKKARVRTGCFSSGSRNTCAGCEGESRCQRTFSH